MNHAKNENILDENVLTLYGWLGPFFTDALRRASPELLNELQNARLSRCVERQRLEAHCASQLLSIITL